MNHLEAMGLLCARLTFPGLFCGRRALCFVDNTAALSAAVHGYANEPDMAAIVNALHCYDAALQCDAWFEWVPSAANVADLPSRRRATWSESDEAFFGGMQGDGMLRRRMRWPATDELDSAASAMAAARLCAAHVTRARL